MKNSDNLKKIIKKINEAKTIAIFTHTKPDGDALGSACAFFSYCKLVGKEADIYLDDDYKPAYKTFLPNVDVIRKSRVEKSYELLICLDTSTLTRLGAYGSLFKRHPNTVRIDHHLDDFGHNTLSHVDSNKSSTCEMLYDLFKTLKTEITADMATCLMTGILTDTGSLSHVNAKASTFKACSNLISFGAKREEISEKLFKATPLKVLKLKAHLINKIEIIGENVAFAILTIKDFNQFDTKFSESEDLVDHLIGIDGIERAVLVYETVPKFFNVSLRGKIGFPVRDFANTLGGGGHALAAGAKMQGSATEVKEKILKELQKFFKQGMKGVK